jgi:hydrogenase-4 component F
MSWAIYAAFGLPLVMSIVVLQGGRRSYIDEIAAALASAGALAAAIVLATFTLRHGTLVAGNGFFRVDALSAFVLVTVAGCSLAAQLFAIGAFEPADGRAGIDLDAGQKFRFLGQLFLASLAIMVMAGSLGGLWIALEGTLLTSALLVGFNRRTVSLEAAWKYVIIGTVGLGLALFGTVLLYIATQRAGADGLDALRWQHVLTTPPDVRLVKVGFVFAFVGFGTLAGLAPMHLWRPDAYRAAPTPVSALLAGCLAPASLYALFRLHQIAAQTIGPELPSMLFRGFGLATMAVAALFVLVQRDFKRLLAFSSIEQAGLAALGIGFGGRMALTGAILHLMSHSIATSLSFFVGGDLEARYRTRDMLRIRGGLVGAPGTARVLVVATAAVVGVPPFLTFTSRFLVLYGGVVRGHTVEVCIALGLASVVLASFARFVGLMTLGEPAPSRRPHAAWRWDLAALTMVTMATVSLLLGVALPGPLRNLFGAAAAALGGP